MTDDLISRQKAIEALMDALNDVGVLDAEDINTVFQMLPSAQPERIIHCKDCKHHWTHKCMDSVPIERCDLGQTFYDAEVDYCSLAKRRGVAT